MLKRKKVKPITLRDVTIIDDGKLRKAITAASLGNAMEWFDFGVYGFVAYALGKVFFPGADPSVQMVAALATFSVPFLIRPLGGLFFGMLGDKYGRQKILAITIVIMSISTFCIGLIPSYDTIGIWAPILLLICKMAQGFSVGGEYTGASIFVAEYSPDRKRGFMGSWLDFGSIAGFVLGAGVVVLISTIVGEANFLDWGWRIPFFIALPLGIIGLYLRHALEELRRSSSMSINWNRATAKVCRMARKSRLRDCHQTLAQPVDMYWSGNCHQRDLLHVADLYAELFVA